MKKVLMMLFLFSGAVGLVPSAMAANRGCSQVGPGGITTGFITSVSANWSKRNLVMVYFHPDGMLVPSDAVWYPVSDAELDSETGRAFLKVALSAYAEGKTVSLYCTSGTTVSSSIVTW
jgi:hypothetical protein